MHANSTASKLNWFTDIIFLTIIFAIFYFLWLGSYPVFTPDEGRYSEVAREMLASGNYITPKVNGVAFLDKPILYYWLQAAAMKLFGIHEWSIRFFPAVYGIHGCLAVYLAARRLFNRLVGLASAFILAATPLYFGGAHYANLDLEVAVLVSSCLLAFLVATESTGRTRFVLFMLAYVFAALAFLTKGLIAIAFPAMIGGLWIVALSRWKLLLRMQLMLGIIVFTAITLPWFILVQRENPQFLHFFFVTQQVTRFLSHAEFNNKTPSWFYIPIVLAGFIPWSAFFIQGFISDLKTSWKARNNHAAEVFLLLWVAVVFIFFSIPRSKVITYILPIFPAMAIITGKYLATAWKTNSHKLGIRLGVIMLIVINLALAFILIELPNRNWLHLSPGISPYLLAAGGELAISAIALLYTLRHINAAKVFLICTITSAVMLLTITMGAKHANVRSAKPLITTLNKRLKPTDSVVNYYKFYQDVPLYLNRTILLVADWDSPKIAQKDNWIRELWYSMPYQNTEDFLLRDSAFWSLWDSNKVVYVFVNANYFQQFLLGTKGKTKKLHFIQRYQDILLLSNQGS